MNPIIQKLQQYEIPTDSYIKAGLSLVRDRDNQPIPDLNQDQYENRIEQLIGEKVTFTDVRIAKYTYLYFVQEFVRIYNSSETMPLIEELYNDVHKKAVSFINENQYHWVVEDTTEIKLDENGKPKKKKGAKKELARQIWSENSSASKEELIALLMEQASLTKKGALTYYYNLKKEFDQK